MNYTLYSLLIQRHTYTVDNLSNISNVKSVAQNVLKCWCVAKNQMVALHFYHNICLQRVERIFRPNKISNKTCTGKLGMEIQKMKYTVQRFK